jgi:alpha-ketoglutarate-dependent taurine dioxygenase
MRTRSRFSSADLAIAVSICIKEGMCTLAVDDEIEMSEIAEVLEVPDADHRVLVAREREDARPGTLSGRYGRAAFPWHTDRAHHAQPPRLSLMRCRAPTDTPTLLLDAHSLLALAPALGEQLRRQTWLVDDGARPFYASIVDRAGRVRFNRHLMRPTSARAGEAELAFQALIEEADPVEHAWQANELLLLDNTRIVHARPPVGENDSNRELERLLCAVPSRLGR